MNSHFLVCGFSFFIRIRVSSRPFYSPRCFLCCTLLTFKNVKYERASKSLIANSVRDPTPPGNTRNSSIARLAKFARSQLLSNVTVLTSQRWIRLGTGRDVLLALVAVLPINHLLRRLYQRGRMDRIVWADAETCQKNACRPGATWSFRRLLGMAGASEVVDPAALINLDSLATCPPESFPGFPLTVTLTQYSGNVYHFICLVHAVTEPLCCRF